MSQDHGCTEQAVSRPHVLLYKQRLPMKYSQELGITICLHLGNVAMLRQSFMQAIMTGFFIYMQAVLSMVSIVL
jgi:hypothetical protein